MSLESDGYEVHSSLVDDAELGRLCEELAPLTETSKVGLRNLVERSKATATLSRSSVIQSLLPGGNMRLVRSLFFDKTPQSNWPVAWHQDRSIAVKRRSDIDGYGPWSSKDGIVHVEPPSSVLESMVTLRLHLDPTGADNGALRVIPGSHLVGKISPDLLTNFTRQPPTVIECRPGDILAMKPLLLHSSRRAENPLHRRVIHLEYAPAASLPPELNWHSVL